MQLKPGALIVFEGLDKTGKSTQVERLQQLYWDPPGPSFLHMPSGAGGLTNVIYQLTEHFPIQTALGRQLLHLACHAEAMEHIRITGRTNGLILDRWHWSTLAYGLGSGDLDPDEQQALRSMVHAVWDSLQADVVLLFGRPFASDPANLGGVAAMYRQLADEHSAITHVVEEGTPDSVQRSIMTALRERDLLQG